MASSASGISSLLGLLRRPNLPHFPSIDHAVLLDILAGVLKDPRVLDLAARIIASGEGVLDQEYRMVWFPGDDLLAACRPRGLPIGNLTSQFWSNCYTAHRHKLRLLHVDYQKYFLTCCI